MSLSDQSERLKRRFDIGFSDVTFHELGCNTTQTRVGLSVTIIKMMSGREKEI